MPILRYNPVLANLSVLLVIALGLLSYFTLPREENPTVNFNWVEVTTLYPGASAGEIEQKVTRPLELSAAGVADIEFILSTSRESISSILVRFEADLDKAVFGKRLADLRRAIDRERANLPATAEDPLVEEITTANAFPVATLALVGDQDNQTLYAQAKAIERELERIDGVDDVVAVGYRKPEIQVRFDANRLARTGLSPTGLTASLERQLQDLASGRIQVNGSDWLLQYEGATADPVRIGALSLLDRERELTLSDVAMVTSSRAQPTQLVRVDGKPAVMFTVTKQPEANTLELVNNLEAGSAALRRQLQPLGLELQLIDDQTFSTRQALGIMGNNAALGLALVLLVGWAFLGLRTAALTSIGIPFILAATLFTLDLIGLTLNIIVLLGMVIALGMLVDTAVVVVEAVQRQLQRGDAAVAAAREAVRQVSAPLTAAVLTTIAAFLPLMLMPGILGQFMFVAPLVVTSALLFSLLHAFWILPAQIAGFLPDGSPQPQTSWRAVAMRRLRTRYGRSVAWLVRRPMVTLGALVLVALGTTAALTSGAIRKDFFASDPYRLFYVDIELPAGTPLARTMEQVSAIDAELRRVLTPQETRALIGYAGQQYTETSPRFGDHLGQILVTLQPSADGLRTVDAVIESARFRLEPVMADSGSLSFQRLRNGPPTSKPVSVRVRGEDFERIFEVVEVLRGAMTTKLGFMDVTDDYRPGLTRLRMQIDGEAARRAGIAPMTVAQTLRLLADGVVVAEVQGPSEQTEVRVLAESDRYPGPEHLLATRIVNPEGQWVPLGTLVETNAAPDRALVRHYNLKRAITLEADIDRTQLDTLAANQLVLDAWQEIADRYPDIDIDLTGAQEDIQESLAALAVLFPIGLGAIYLILGTQFRSYTQPLLILITVPLAFVGVVVGLLVTSNPLSLYTLYGIVALAGIAVNAAIVMVDAANRRVGSGMRPAAAVVLAARERVVPVLITSITTIAGLSSLAMGLAGDSLTWGPLATAIVWGLLFSTLLTLVFVPPLYLWLTPKAKGLRGMAPRPRPDVEALNAPAHQ